MNASNVTFQPTFIHNLVADMLGDLRNNLLAAHFQAMHRIMLTSTQPVVDTSNFRDLMMNQGWEIVVRDITGVSPAQHVCAWGYADAMLDHLMRQTAEPAEPVTPFPLLDIDVPDPVVVESDAACAEAMEQPGWLNASDAEASPPPPATIAADDVPDVGTLTDTTREAGPDTARWPFPQATEKAPLGHAPANVAEPVNGFDPATFK